MTGTLSLNVRTNKMPCVYINIYITFVSVFVTQTADINDMKICYVLLDGSNATSDIFYFTVEDNGRNLCHFLII